MAVEFRCSSCDKLLRTPDESVGKKAKCPHCAAVVDVPGPSSFGADALAGGPYGTVAAESLPSDKHGLSDASKNPFGDMPPDTSNPYASPGVSAATDYSPHIDRRPRGGLPWETEGKSAGSYWRTCKLVIFNPTTAFQQMKREGGLGDPIIFAMIGGVLGGLATAVYNSIVQALIMAIGGIAGAGAGGGGPEVGMMVGVGAFQIVANFVGAFVGGTIGTLIGLFIGAGITHLMLILLKGANFPFETTFRVVSFTAGAVALSQVIPFFGQIINLVMSIVCEIVGLIHAQEISGGKACLAVFLPMIFCCLVCGLSIGAIVAVIIANS